MSAGGLSYSGITNKGKVTLPSIDNWYTNTNILRDPPKSIHTRRIDKVGQTSSITSMIDDSGNRACEGILQYQRGINPSVSVDYGNYGNNGGQRSNGLSLGEQAQAKLPYRILQNGQFRPPVLRQENLRPLSRLPRVWTNAFTNPEFPIYTQRLRDCGTDQNTKEVRRDILKVAVQPTGVFKLETPIIEPFDVSYTIKDPIRMGSVTSGIRPLNRTELQVIEPVKGIDRDLMHINARANPSENRYVNNTNFNSDPYIQDINHINMVSNSSSNRVHHTPIEDILDLSAIRTKDTLHSNYTTPISSNGDVGYIHDNIHLDRKLPEYEATTNIGKNIYKRAEYENEIELDRNRPLAEATTNMAGGSKGVIDNISSRTYKLTPKVSPGGFEGKGTVPAMEYQQYATTAPFETEKSRLGKLAMSQFEGRYGPPLRGY